MSDLNLDPTQLDRYARHIVMDDVGPDGQAALLDAAVLVIGAGGLGSPAIQYLAAAGVGRLGIVDDDVVERSNLQRQIVHADADVGRPKVESAAAFVRDLNPDVTVEAKVESAAAFVRDLNPDVTVEAIEERVTPGTVTELVTDYDFVLDASDNFATRYLVNDACTLAGVPFSHGSIYRFEGQVTTFAGGDGPCYRCVFPEAPPPGEIPNCAEAGVLGVLPGTVGCVQATEAIKWLLLDAGLLPDADLLDGRLLFYDAMDMTFETVPVRRDPDCPVCGEDPAVSSVHDVAYEASCAISDD